MSNLGDEEKIRTYREALHTAALAVHMLRLQPLDLLLEAIERAHAIGPMVDPTLYRDKAKAMNEDRALLKAARDFVVAVDRGRGSQ